MLSILESIFDGKLRQRSEVYIIKDRKLLIGIGKKPSIPGGKIDSGENAESAARREALEEVGVEVKNLRKIREYSFNYVDEFGPWETLPYDITRWNELGMHVFSFVGEFVKENKKVFNIEGDGRKYKLMSYREAISEFKKIKDKYLLIRVKHIISIIIELKNKNLID